MDAELLRVQFWGLVRLRPISARWSRQVDLILTGGKMCINKAVTYLATSATIIAVGNSLAMQASAQDSEIIVGMAVAESGFMAAYDGDGTNAIKLWVDDQNAKGGLLGRKIKWILSDTKSDLGQSGRSGQEIVDQGADIVVVSGDYDYGSPAAAAAQRAGRLSVFLGAEDPKAGVQGAGAYAFTSSVAAQVQGATIAGWAHTKLGAKTQYTLLDSINEYNKSLCGGYTWGADLVGLTSVGSDTFKNDDPSIQPQITRILALPEKPDVLMVCSYIPGGASAIRQLRAAGLTMPILSGSSMDGTYWVDAVPNLNDFYIPAQASVHGDDPRPEVNEFVAKFRTKYGHAPATVYGVLPYTFLDLWARAVEKAGTADAASVVPVMEQYKDEMTMIGPRSFTSQLHIQDDAPMQILKYENAKPKVVDQYRISEPVPFEVLFRTKN
ncbi:ABC transporter substrate-binding protein [Sinorhizobium meliloti]|uniref:ABC transporter substrate-binding protein n=2 Tax=Rhizobium meliloti TaxID=382 RepID=UPI001F1DD4C4|nr:ABC transporter substrate-binding protein [Sinorhizobium meliloti]